MAGETITFFEKYTSLGGDGAVYYSEPFEVTSFKSLVLEVLLRAIVGTTPSADAQMEQSSDLITWSDLGTPISLTAGTAPDGDTYENPARYVRLKITTAGTGVVATLWAKAVARDS